MHRDAYGDAYGDAYASCRECGEYAGAALRTIGGLCLCANCADNHHQRGVCSICEQTRPIEAHHIAGRRHASDTIPACLNCHRMLSRQQYQWHPSWRAQPMPARHTLFMLQGALDSLCLWCMRSRAPEHRKIMSMALVVLVLWLTRRLCPERAADIHDLVLMGGARGDP